MHLIAASAPLHFSSIELHMQKDTHAYWMALDREDGSAMLDVLEALAGYYVKKANAALRVPTQ